MGDRGGRPNEQPVHEVKVAAFYMDVYEVTQADFARYDLPNPAHFKGSRASGGAGHLAASGALLQRSLARRGLEPCYNEDTAECNFAANGYRLPTEAEWEYACRAGVRRPTRSVPTTGQLGRFAWFKDNASKKTHPVGQKQPNSWGLYDMHGNVSEWCNDIYDESYYQKSPSENPTGPAEGKQYILRGDRGPRALTPTGPRTGSVKTQAFRTLAWLATRSASGAFASAWPRQDRPGDLQSSSDLSTIPPIAPDFGHPRLPISLLRACCFTPGSSPSSS